MKRKPLKQSLAEPVQVTIVVGSRMFIIEPVQGLLVGDGAHEGARIDRDSNVIHISQYATNDVLGRLLAAMIDTGTAYTLRERRAAAAGEHDFAWEKVTAPALLMNGNLSRRLPRDALAVLARPGMVVTLRNHRKIAAVILDVTRNVCTVQTESGERVVLLWHEVELINVQPDPECLAGAMPFPEAE